MMPIEKPLIGEPTLSFKVSCYSGKAAIVKSIQEAIKKVYEHFDSIQADGSTYYHPLGTQFDSNSEYTIYCFERGTFINTFLYLAVKN